MVRLMRWIIGFLLTGFSSTISNWQNGKTKQLKKYNSYFDTRQEDGEHSKITGTSRRLLEVNGNCTEPSIDDFPEDFFTQEQRAKGGLVIHFLLGMYACYGLAAVCDTYFVPSLSLISNKLGISSDVAGATFMAAGTSSPELFESIIGSFITEGDIGVGTIVGSAVFNILAVTAVCGILTGMVVPLDWWPLTRDCAFYAISVVALVIMIRDERIYWYESTVLLVMFVLYVLMMYFNRPLAKFFHSLSWCQSKSTDNVITNDPEQATETSAVITKENEAQDMTSGNIIVRQAAIAIAHDAFGTIQPQKEGKEELSANGSKTNDEANNGLLEENPLAKNYEDLDADDEEEWGPTLIPGGFFPKLAWFITWPINLLFYLTIPNCNKQRWEKFYPLTFFMSVLYIGSLSYFVAWMVTVIGYTIGIPDTVMGITFLAIGTSVPEGYSSVIVCRKGYGNMAISNSVGSNIFDILFCLGLPWLIKATAFSTTGYVQINSSGLVYSTISLLLTVVLLYMVIVIFRFKLNLKVGITCLVLYSVFLTFASLVELNVLGQVNPPACS